MKAVSLLNSFVSFVENVNRIVGRGVSFFTVGMIIPIVLEVVLRYVIKRPTIWAHEMSTMFFGAFWV